MAKAKIQKKYLAGLKESTANKRKAEFRKRIEGKVKGKDQYKPVAGDNTSKKTRPSSYTLSMGKLREEILEQAPKEKGTQTERFLSATSKVTGIPRSIIKKVYNKGMQAWATGHRPNVPQAAWARARVYSFLQKGKAVTKGPDLSLYMEAKEAIKNKSGFKLK